MKRNSFIKGSSISFIIFLLLTSCGSSNTPNEPIDTRPLKERLEDITDLVNIIEIEQYANPFLEKYLLEFEMPVDWNNPDGMKFNQRVEFGFVGYDNVTVYQCNGYTLYDNYFSYDDRNELAKLYDANFVNFEYRYFGESIPEGLDYQSTDLWGYLTSENASKDFNHIISELKPILKGKSLFTGGSKGGLTTNTLACYFPDSVDCYVSYVAPNCNSIADPRMATFLYEEAGEKAYGANKAKQYRDGILNFQIACLELREEMQDTLYNYAIDGGAEFLPYVTKERLFDLTLMDAGIGSWQYYLDFKSYLSALSYDRTTESGKKSFISAAMKILKTNGDPIGGISVNSMYFPYFFQSFTELGNYVHGFSYVRDELKNRGQENLFAIKEDEEPTAWLNTFMTKEMQEAYPYSSSYSTMLDEWVQTTTTNIIMINGGLDPWNAVRIADTDNPHIHRYTIADENHAANIKRLPASKQEECIGLLNSWLDVTAEE